MIYKNALKDIGISFNENKLNDELCELNELIEKNNSLLEGSKKNYNEDLNDLACYTLLTIYDIVNSFKKEDNDLTMDFCRSIFESKELVREVTKIIKYSSYDKMLNLNKNKSILLNWLKSLSKEDIINYLDELEKKCKTDALFYKNTSDELDDNFGIKYKRLSEVYMDSEKGSLTISRKVLSESKVCYVANTIGEKLSNGAGKLVKKINYKNK